MIGRYLKAMVGVRDHPPLGESLVLTLIDNGTTETRAMGAWIPAWAVTGALLLLVGRAVHSWDRPSRMQILALAAIPLAVSVMGFIIHMVRAGLAVSEGQKLALTRLPGGAYSRAVACLTATTPWLLIPQIVLGVAFALLVTAQT